MKRVTFAIGLFLASIIASSAQEPKRQADNFSLPPLLLTTPEPSHFQSPNLNSTTSEFVGTSLWSNKHRSNPACQSGQKNQCTTMKLRHGAGSSVNLLHQLAATAIVASSQPTELNALDVGPSSQMNYGPQTQNLTLLNVGGLRLVVDTRDPLKIVGDSSPFAIEDARLRTSPVRLTQNSSLAPSISSYSPGFGLPGTAITIIGKGFGTTQGNSYVTVLAGSQWMTWPGTTSWTDTQVVVNVPANTPQGKVYLGLVVNNVPTVGTYPFTVGIPPAITSYSPGYGIPGSSITIEGTGFGTSQGNSYIWVWTGIQWMIWPVTTNWTDTQIVVTVPQSMPLGLVALSIVVNGLQSIGTYPFTVGVPPMIASYSPGFGPVGTALTINGTGFGASQGSSYVSVLSENQWVTWSSVRTWTDSQIVVTIPTNIPAGKIYLSVVVNGLRSIGTYPFTIGIPPEIDCYSPLFGPPGSSLAINGSGFGATQGNSYVYVLSSVTNEWTAWPTVTSWSDGQIIVTVPANMPLGKIYLSVVVNGLQTIGTFPFTVGIPPMIADYSPTYGLPGSTVTITGTGFGASQSSSFVYMLSSVTNEWMTWPTIVSWSDTQIAVVVPTSMPLGKVYINVVVNELQSIGTYPFTVGIPPFINTYSPSSGSAGTTITINGSGFGATQGSSSLNLLSLSNVWTTLTVASWSDSQIVATVPALTPKGSNYLSVTVNGLQSIGTYPFCIN
jgi:hypothetical protein